MRQHASATRPSRGTPEGSFSSPLLQPIRRHNVVDIHLGNNPDIGSLHVAPAPAFDSECGDAMYGQLLNVQNSIDRPVPCLARCAATPRAVRRCASRFSRFDSHCRNLGAVGPAAIGAKVRTAPRLRRHANPQKNPPALAHCQNRRDREHARRAGHVGELQFALVGRDQMRSKPPPSFSISRA